MLNSQLQICTETKHSRGELSHRGSSTGCNPPRGRGKEKREKAAKRLEEWSTLSRKGQKSVEDEKVSNYEHHTGETKEKKERDEEIVISDSHPLAVAFAVFGIAVCFSISG